LRKRSAVNQSPDEVIDRGLEVLHAHDQWLTGDRQAIDAKIRRGVEELDRGEGIPEDELDAHLERLKAQPE
jgi:predicted transcriptional regulator